MNYAAFILYYCYSYLDWMSETTVTVDSGDYKGFLKADGTFAINNLPSGSYLVEVASPNYQFDRYRVDITKGGKIRARQVNFLQPNSVHVVPYPLRFVASRQAPFFEIREAWKATDLLYNPMVCIMYFCIIQKQLLNIRVIKSSHNFELLVIPCLGGKFKINLPSLFFEISIWLISKNLR